MRALSLWLATLLSGAAVAQPTVVASTSRTDAAGNRTMIQTVEIETSTREIYHALTTAEGWRRWAVPAAREISRNPHIIETSYDPKAPPGDAATIRQQFVRKVPNRLVVYRTIKAPSGFEEFETYRHVVNRVELTPLDGRRTKVRVSAGPYPDTPAGRKLFGFFEQGNRKTLENMAEVLGRGSESQFAIKRP